jgi:hypothetical protein
MVAMLILSLCAILSMRSMEQADRVARRAEEIRQARTLLNELIDNGPRDLTPTLGATGPFQWTLETQPTGADRPVAVCRRVASLTTVGTPRRYVLATLEACPPESGA